VPSSSIQQKFLQQTAAAAAVHLLADCAWNPHPASARSSAPVCYIIPSKKYCVLHETSRLDLTANQYAIAAKPPECRNSAEIKHHSCLKWKWLVFLFAVGCGSVGSWAQELVYHNPLWEGYLADPQVLYHEGYYYAYGTDPSEEGSRFPILRSANLTDWTYMGRALEPVREPNLRDCWAPEVIEHQGKFYLYYAGNQRMRVAIADNPLGPFRDCGVWLFPEEPFSIDGHPFWDPVSQRWYLFFAKDFFDQRVGTGLAVVLLGKNMISTEGPVRTVLRPFADWQIYQRNRTLYNRQWDAWHTVEGPFVVYRDGLYYCFYSGGNWQTPGYGVGCAVASDIQGPFEDPWSHQKASVLSTIPNQLIGPGHNSIILGPDRQTWFLFYHSWNPQRTARQICMDPLIWTAQGPKVWNPSRGTKRIPLPLSSSGRDPNIPNEQKEIESDLFGTFINPVYEGADPFVYKHTDGRYYFCQSEGDKGISVWKSDKLTDKGIKRVVWRSPPTGWNTSNVWAPEIHYLEKKWYIYYAADDGDNTNHRAGVLESVSEDAQGDYRDRGMLYTGDQIQTGRDNRWAIDATALQMGGKLYLVWSGWSGSDDDIQALYIAEMANPWTVKTNRVKIADNDTYSWERVSEDLRQRGLNEAPQVLYHGDRVYLIYSCSGSWEPTYKLGQLSIQRTEDPMNPANWVKKDQPVFEGTETVFGVGHASFTLSPDGSENWIVYHSKVSALPGWQRNVRLQPFVFRPDGSPDFGKPIPSGKVLKKPSGEPLPRKGTHFKDCFDDNRWDHWQYFGYHRFIDVQDGCLRLGHNPEWGMANAYRMGEKAVVRDWIWDDFLFQAKLQIMNGNQAVGLIFRVQHPALGYQAMKGYFAGIEPDNQTIILGKIDGRNWIPITNKKYPCRTRQWYTLQVSAIKEQIHVFVDKELILTAQDDDYPVGYAGVRVVDTDAQFDEIELYAQ